MYTVIQTIFIFFHVQIIKVFKMWLNLYCIYNVFAIIVVPKLAFMMINGSHLPVLSLYCARCLHIDNVEWRSVFHL